MVLENGTLVIENADFDDTGSYTCRANNTAGTNQIVITIDVVSEEGGGERGEVKRDEERKGGRLKEGWVYKLNNIKI